MSSRRIVKRANQTGLKSLVVTDDRGNTWGPVSGMGLRRSISAKRTCRSRYRAGYETVPEDIRHAVLLMVGQLYSVRGERIDNDLVEDPAIKALLAPYRMWGA